MLLLLSSFFLTLVGSFAMLKYVRLRGFLDAPDEDRKIHTGTIPRFGGIPFAIISLSLSMVYVRFDPAYSWYIFGVFIIFMIGLMDDVYRISWRVKTFSQLFVGTLIFSQFANQLPILKFFGFSLDLHPILFGLIFIVWFLGILNAVNLADGMDGLAGGSFFIISLGASYLGWASQHPTFMQFYLILAAALLGFLFYNGRPAKFFMGDTGSLFLGFNLAAMPLIYLMESTPNEPLDLTPFIILASYFIIDTLRVFYIRIRQKQNPLTPDNNHFHHQLYYFTHSYNATLFVIYFLNCLFCLLSINTIYQTLNLKFLLIYIVFLLACIFIPQPKSLLLVLSKFILIRLKYLNKRIFRKRYKFNNALLRWFILIYLLFQLFYFAFIATSQHSYFSLLLFFTIFVGSIAMYKMRMLGKKLLILNIIWFYYYALVTYELSSTLVISSYFNMIKIAVLPVFLTLFIVFSFRYISSFLMKFWIVEDLLLVILTLFIMLINSINLPTPLLFPTNRIICELVLVYLALRSILIEKHTGQIRAIK